MNIGIDAREIQNGVVTGIGRSLANYIEYFQTHNKDRKLVLFSENEINANQINNVDCVVLPPKFNVLFWDQVLLPSSLKINEIDLFYSPYYKAPLATRIPIITQILDLMWLGFQPYKESIGITGKLYYSLFGKAFAKKSLSIITDSEHAKSDIIKFWNINPNKIEVIPLGLADRYRPVYDAAILNKVKTKLKLPEKYILYLGNFKPHKNLKSLVYAFKKIEQKFLDYKLVLAGPLDQHGRVIQKLISDLDLTPRVLFTDTIKEKDNPEALLTMAEVFVFPTLYEGFGLPPLEAMACGTPVVASNLTSVPEVVGDACLSVNPLDINEISHAITDLIENPAKRKTYSEYGLERASQFREKDTTAKLYHHIISIAENIQ
jgi:glycosyltransferase involved in cell wall biosynthesis